MTEKQYIRANLELKATKCRTCGAEIVKNNDKQIVYHCSRECRKGHIFKWVREVK